jgi:TonB family protein
MNAATPRARRCALLLALVLAGTSRSALAQNGELVPPRLVEKVEPVLPEGKLAPGERATVLLYVSIDAEGAVTDATVVESGGAELDASALAAAKKLRFEPARRGDRAIASRVPFRFEFAREAEVPAVPRRTASSAGASSRRRTSRSAARRCAFAQRTASLGRSRATRRARFSFGSRRIVRGHARGAGLRAREQHRDDRRGRGR